MSSYGEAIFLHLSEAVILIDPYADQVIDANPEALKLLGRKREGILKLGASRLFMPSLAEMITFSQCVLHKGRAWSNELYLQGWDDELLRVEVAASLLEQEDRTLLLCVLRNFREIEELRHITEANSLHREGLERWKSIEAVFTEFERQNQLILSAAGEGIYGVDTDGNTTFVNPAAERMLGWKAEDMIGKNIHSMIHHTHLNGHQYPAHECHIFAAFRDGEVRHVDNEVFWCKSSNPIPVEYTSTPIVEEGRLVGAVVIFRDISERKQAEEKLRAALDEVQALKKKLEMENAYLQEAYLSEHNYKEIVGHSAAINQVIQQIELVAPTNAAVLITGESGTGKELIARGIHESSTRQNRPLIRVNCASIPHELFESEFFGHIKGAFTGAIQDRAGRFELADGGTLFLDEIGEIPLSLQSKLLRVLQEQQFERVGESKTRRVDVRIIAATNRELKEEVKAKRFREDLYFRLNVFPILSMPLRERVEDIPLLAAHFLDLACQKFGRTRIQLTRGDIERMQGYHWPGNIRELINVIERAVILSREGRLNLDFTSQIHHEATQTIPVTASGEIKTSEELQRMEQHNIILALQHCNGKLFGEDGAAAMLGIKPTTLASRLKKLGINRHRYINNTELPNIAR